MDWISTDKQITCSVNSDDPLVFGDFGGGDLQRLITSFTDYERKVKTDLLVQNLTKLSQIPAFHSTNIEVTPEFLRNIIDVLEA